MGQTLQSEVMHVITHLQLQASHSVIFVKKKYFQIAESSNFHFIFGDSNKGETQLVNNFRVHYFAAAGKHSNVCLVCVYLDVQ